jgi:hypothetical protein
MKLKWQWRRRVGRLSGQSLIEYAFILMFVFTVCVVILRAIGPSVNNKLGPVNSNLQ